MITDRILKIIELYNENKSKFYKKTGLSNGFLDKVKDIGVSKLDYILNSYPDINPEWLLTGKGEMLRQKEAPIVPIVNEKDSYIIELQKDKIRSLEKELQNQRQEIEQLKKELSSVPVVKRGDNYI